MIFRTIQSILLYQFLLLSIVYNTSNSINNTNIIITGLPLTDTNYTVTIIPVNIIGYGPSKLMV